MKTIILFAAVLSLFFTGNVYSQKISTFKENTDNNGYKTREYVSENKQRAKTKIIFRYDTLGNVIERTYYSRGNGLNWVPLQKHAYLYNKEGKIADIIFTKRDQLKDEWEKKSLHFIHLYNKGQLIVQQVEKDTDTEYLLTQR